MNSKFSIWKFLLLLFWWKGLCDFPVLVIYFQDHSLIRIILLSSQNYFGISSNALLKLGILWYTCTISKNLGFISLREINLSWPALGLTSTNVLKLPICFSDQLTLVLKPRFSVSNLPSLFLSSMGKNRFNRFILNLKLWHEDFKAAFISPMYQLKLCFIACSCF